VYKNSLKRILDLIVASVVFLVLFPIIFIVAVLLAIHFGGSPFFIQKRPGKNERIFSIIKFKTMSNQKDSEGNLLPDADRLTAFGRFIRASSLDELVRVTKPKGHIIFSQRCDAHEALGFKEKQEELESVGRWKLVEVSDCHRAFSRKESDVLHQVWVYQVL